MDSGSLAQRACWPLPLHAPTDGGNHTIVTSVGIPIPDSPVACGPTATEGGDGEGPDGEDADRDSSAGRVPVEGDGSGGGDTADDTDSEGDVDTDTKAADDGECTRVEEGSCVL